MVRAVAAGVLLVTGLTWSQRPAEAPIWLSVGTGGPGGVYHVYGAGLAEVSRSFPDTRVTAVATAASVQNVELIADRKVDAAFTLADVAALAVAGDPPFAGPQPIAAVARLYDNHTHLVVRADSPYEAVADLAGATVSLGAAGSGTEMMAERLLALAGLEEDADEGGVDRVRLSIRGSANALAEGRIDAFFWSGGLPTLAVADLAEQVPLRLVDLAEHVPALGEEYGAYFTELPVPAGTYPDIPAVRTIGVPSMLIVHADMPDKTAHRFTQLLFASRAELLDVHPVALQLSRRGAIATAPVPLHPGAARYYRSVKSAHDADTR